MSTITVWTLAASLIGFLAIWPLVTSMVAANDDLKFLRGEAYSGSLWQNIAEGWTSQTSFRPLENLVASMCDPYSLECRWALVFQFAGLLVLILALRSIATRLFGSCAITLPLLIIWLVLSPATSVSLWQMDTCSQTWTAALGAVIGVVCISGFDAACRGAAVWPQIATLVLLCALAVNIKEMFYGWSAGIGIALFIAVASLWRRERRAALRTMIMFVPVALLPAAHLLFRWQFAGLGLAAKTATESATGLANVEPARYQVGIGFNLVTNAWISLLGVFSNGPLHLVRDVAAPILLRLLPLAALVAVFVLLAAASAMSFLHPDPARRSSRRLLLLSSMAGLMSLTITLPMSSVSELYGFGANAATGLLIVAAILSLWNPVHAQERTLTRTIAAGCAAIVLASGVYGLASRARHFQLTWLYARELNQAVLQHQQAINPDDPIVKTQVPARMFFSAGCLSGRVHNQYIVPPILALGVDQTMNWMNRTHPERPVIFVGPTAPLSQREIDDRIRCEDLPRRPSW